MKTEKRTKPARTEIVKGLVSDLPYFGVENLSLPGIKKYYLNILLSRLKEKGEIISLKRGVYVSRAYLEKIKRERRMNQYLEFLSGTLYSPSYLSLEYVLSENNILSENIFSFTSISTKKTNRIRSKLGVFSYHSIRRDLFTGFKTLRKGDFYIHKATPAKAMFDFLYLRKNLIVNREFLESLRLNWDYFTSEDVHELEEYVNKEGGGKMAEIYTYLNKIKNGS